MSNKFELSINIDNAAFENYTAWEVARILEYAANRLKEGYSGITLFDSNGNKVGFADYNKGE